MIPAVCDPLPETIEAIQRADLITFGPGSLYTSVIPNLLVKGIPEAIEQSPALKVCLMNLMWQPGETINFSASRHVKEIHKHAGRELIDGETRCARIGRGISAAGVARLYGSGEDRSQEAIADKRSAGASGCRACQPVARKAGAAGNAGAASQNIDKNLTWKTT